MMNPLGKNDLRGAFGIVSHSNWTKAAASAAIACLVGSWSFEPGQAAQQDRASPYAPTSYQRFRVGPAEQAARQMLDTRIAQLGRYFPGRVGIAVRDIQTGFSSSWQGTLLFPQQSVSKFWVALTALEKADRGELNLDAPVVVRREDLTLFHQPIAALVKGGGYATTLRALMVRALTESDNTANDFILRRAGGPEAVRSFLHRHRLEGVRFGPGERLMQSQTAGLSWRQEYAIGDAFYRARAGLPVDARRAAFERYLADPVDGASALGLADGLLRLRRGELLSPGATGRLLGIMSNTKTGRQRLKGGLAPGWTLAHKTGTGQNFAGQVAGYNDVGIITCPNGHSYAVAVMIGRTSASIPVRQRLMNEVVRAAIAYDDMLRAERPQALFRPDAASSIRRR